MAHLEGTFTLEGIVVGVECFDVIRMISPKGSFEESGGPSEGFFSSSASKGAYVGCLFYDPKQCRSVSVPIKKFVSTLQSPLFDVAT